MDAHQIVTVATIAAVYVGMALGRWPGLAIDRTGIALCGAILLLLVDARPADALERVDVGALAILFGLMVLSAQFAAAGFYEWCAHRLAGSAVGPHMLLAFVIATTGLLSSVLANDVVVFAMTPILCDGLMRSGRDPRPYLFGLAGAANVGSAATLVGNPQNILIGEHGGLDFWAYLGFAGPLAVLGLVLVHISVAWVWRRALAEARACAELPASDAPALDKATLLKGCIAVAGLLALYMTDLPRWQSTLLVAGVLLVSRRLSSRGMLATVDWHLLVLFASLFVVTGVLDSTRIGAEASVILGRVGLSVEDLSVIAAAALIGSNTVGNVPFVIFALAAFPTLSPDALQALAILSTFAGNLLIVGSLANLIVAERCQRMGVPFNFADHMRAGVPMTLSTMGLAVGWLLL